jgi:hypothetical protein
VVPAAMPVLVMAEAPAVMAVLPAAGLALPSPASRSGQVLAHLAACRRVPDASGP